MDRIGITAVVFAIGVAAAGCGATGAELLAKEDFVVTAPALKGAKIDAKASTLAWETGLSVNLEYARELSAEKRDEFAEGLNIVLGSTDGGEPARYRIRVKELESNMGLAFAPCFVLLTMFGCPARYEKAAVEVDLEVDGKVYTSAGEGSAVTFLYTREIKAISLARALVDAMRKIDAQAVEGAEPEPEEAR